MSNRIKVLKTYKIFIDGKFPRTESGRYVKLVKNNIPIANVCLSSRKDLKNSVASARKIFDSWASKSAYNRAQIMYRIAEMLESRKEQYIEELILQGYNKEKSIVELDKSIDRIIYFAGWSDKINQVFGSVNPVASSHYNFTVLEPSGVVGLISSEESPLLGLISLIIPAIVTGNTTVIIASEKFPLTSISLAEVISNSDVPGGVVNILTGSKSELIPHLARHMDVNSIGFTEEKKDLRDQIYLDAVNNLKRVVEIPKSKIESEEIESPYIIKKFMEAKTTWHPIEKDFTFSNSY